MPIRIVSTTLLVAALHVVVQAQDLTGTIQGVVVGSPPAGAQVRAMGDFVMVTTDAAPDGSFTFTDVPLGVYQVQLVTATGRILAATRVRLTPQLALQSVSLKIRPPLAALGGAVEEAASFQAGPVGITPSVALLNGGVDTNVFNDKSSPKRDNAFVLRPDAVVTLDTAQVRGEGSVNGQYLYFDKYSGERSLDVAAHGGLELTEGRFSPWGKGQVDGGRRRINHEVDLRTRQFSSGLQVGLDTRVASRTIASVAIGRSDYGFDPDQIFRGANLQEVLNRRVVTTTVEARETLNDSLSAVGQVNVDVLRFRFSPQRDARIVRLLGGVRTEQGDRAAGSLRLGYLRLNGTGSAMADYGGFAASVDEDVRGGARTRLLITGERDVDYSFDSLFPYYIRSAARVDLLIQLSRAWDLALIADGERMRHEPAKTLTASLAAYADQYGFIGGGMQFRIARGLRIGVDGGREERHSPIADRGFTGYRYGMSVATGTRPARAGAGFLP